MSKVTPSRQELLRYLLEHESRIYTLPISRYAQNLSKILYKIEQSSLERLLIFILWDFEQSDNIESSLLEHESHKSTLCTLVATLKIFQKSYIKSSNPHLKDF